MSTVAQPALPADLASMLDGWKAHYDVPGFYFNVRCCCTIESTHGNVATDVAAMMAHGATCERWAG